MDLKRVSGRGALLLGSPYSRLWLQSGKWQTRMMAENILEKEPTRVIISLDDALALRSKVQSQRRAALNMELNARRFVEASDGILKILDLIIEPGEARD